MAISEKYEIDGSDEVFDNPIDAVKAAMIISQTTFGAEVKVYRAVKYTHGEWKRYTLNIVKIPQTAIQSGMDITGDNTLNDGLTTSMKPYSTRF